jgi:hypothetical protein
MSTKRPLIELRGANRRNFIKYSIAVGALLGLDRWKIFEVTESTAGKALASQMSCVPNNRSVHIVAGNGGFAWFQLLWPHVDVAAANDPNLAFHAPGMAVTPTGTDKPLALAPEAPWQGKSAAGVRLVSAFMSGSNETHRSNPVSSSTIGSGVGLFAACAALQSSTPTLVPVIGVSAGNTAMPYGMATGAPGIAQVGNSAGMVDLFNSAASSAMGTLSNTKDAALYEAYYKGFLGLSAAAGRSTYVRGLNTGKVSSNLLGINLASQLMPSTNDLSLYGLNSGSPTKLLELGKSLITTAKAFKLGLASMVIIPAMNDDPHGAFNNMSTLQSTVQSIGKILDAFYADLAGIDDPTCSGTKIADNTVLSVHGDTPKTPLNRSGWPDGTPGNANWAYVYGAGYTKTGWFGGIMRDGTVNGFDPTTGNSMAGQAASATAQSASAAVAYAVTKGDMRRVGDFYRGPAIDGITVPKTQ